MSNRWENNENSDRLYFWGLQGNCIWWLQPLVINECLLLGRKTMTNLDTILKSRDITSQSYGFSSSHVCMWELDYKESWAQRNWQLWTLMLEKTLESPLDCKEIQPVNPKGNQSWMFIESTDAEAETPILWPPDVRNWLIGQDPDARKYWRWEEKGMTEDEMVGWHHRLNGHEFEQAPRVSNGQGRLACCSPWSRRVGHDWVTELNCSGLNGKEILKKISPEYSLEGLMLKLKLQYFDYLMWRADLLGKTLMLGKIKGGRRRGWQKMRWLDGITTQWTWVSINSRSWWWTGRPSVLQSMGSQRFRQD